MVACRGAYGVDIEHHDVGGPVELACLHETTSDLDNGSANEAGRMRPGPHCAFFSGRINPRRKGERLFEASAIGPTPPGQSRPRAVQGRLSAIVDIASVTGILQRIA